MPTRRNMINEDKKRAKVARLRRRTLRPKATQLLAFGKMAQVRSIKRGFTGDTFSMQSKLQVQGHVNCSDCNAHHGMEGVGPRQKATSKLHDKFPGVHDYCQCSLANRLAPARLRRGNTGKRSGLLLVSSRGLFESSSFALRRKGAGYSWAHSVSALLRSRSALYSRTCIMFDETARSADSTAMKSTKLHEI